MGKIERNVLHVFGWVVLGLAIGAIAALLRPRPLGLMAMLTLSTAGAVFGGFVSWIFWDFPGTVSSSNEFWATPALISDCVAACGALVALSLATGAVMRGPMDSRSSS